MTRAVVLATLVSSRGNVSLELPGHEEDGACLEGLAIFVF